MDRAIIERFSLRYLEEVASRLYELQVKLDQGEPVSGVDLMQAEVKVRVVMKVIANDARQRGVLSDWAVTTDDESKEV